ncbi:hypothetical protein DL771_003095 [Monosporascus sp. 5C6A]|nr:hypothetical protein DL771_003095 [Monosporascus sp. 5C6A]
MPHAGARRGGWHRKGAGRHQPVPDQNNVRKYQATTLQEIFAVVKRQRELFQMAPMCQYVTSTPKKNAKTRSMLESLPEEMILSCVELLSDSNDLFALARTGSKTLHRIAIHQLLKTNSRTLYSALYWACMNGDLELLGTTMKLRADVDYGFPASLNDPRCRSSRYPCARTPLAVSVSHGNLDVAEALLREYRADSNAFPASMGSTNMRPTTSLQWAFQAGMNMETRLRLLELLLDYNASPDPLRNPPPVDEGDVPIILALKDDRVPAEIVRRMVAASSDLAWNGSSINIVDHYAYYQHYIRTHGTRDGWPSPSISPADLDADLEEGESFTANEFEKLKILRGAVLSPDGTAKRPDWTHITFVEDALHADLRPAKQRQLLELSLVGCSPLREMGTYSRHSPLLMAVNGLIYKRRRELNSDRDWQRILRLLQMLLDAGMNIPQDGVSYRSLRDRMTWDRFAANNWGLQDNPLACLCVSGYGDSFPVKTVVDFLIQHGTPVDTRDWFGLTALHFACKFTNVDLVDQLLGHAADVNAIDINGVSALHFACRSECSSVGEDCALSDEDHDASAEKRAQIVSLLLRRGADPTTTDDEEDSGDEEVRTPLHYACKYGFLGVVRVLLADERVDVNAGLLLHSLSDPLDYMIYNNPNSPPLQLICNKDKAEIAELLIAAGADVRARNRLGDLPIREARERRLLEVVDVLLGHGGDDGFGREGSTCLESDLERHLRIRRAI